MRVAAQGAPPSRRSDPGVACDFTRQRILFFGGGYLSDLWLLELSSSPRWTQVQTQGPAPEATRAQAAIYDPVGDRFVVWTGEKIWSLPAGEPSAWSLVLDSTPGATTGGYAFYDAARQRMLAMASGMYGSHPSPLFALELAGSPTWSELTSASSDYPIGALGVPIFDSEHDRIITFGGAVGQSTTRELPLRPDPSTGVLQWRDLEVTLVGREPEGRLYLASTFDPVAGRLVVHAGHDTQGSGDYFADTWALSLRETPAPWERLDADPGNWPMGATFVEPSTDRLMLLALPDALWSTALGNEVAWTLTRTNGIAPAVTTGVATAVDPVAHRLLVFGGAEPGGTTGHDELWSLSLDGVPTWSRIDATGDVPPPRVNANMFYDDVEDRVLLVGGWDESGVLAHVWELSLRGSAVWRRMPEAGDPATIPELFPGSAWLDARHHRLITASGLGDVYVGVLGDSVRWSNVETAVVEEGRNSPYGELENNLVITADGDRLIRYARFGFWTLTLSVDPVWRRMRVCGGPIARKFTLVSDPRRSRLLTGPGGNGEYSIPTVGELRLFDHSVSTSTGLVTAEVRNGVVSLVWSGKSVRGFEVAVERRTPTAAWTEIARVLADSRNRIVFEDHSVTPGFRYAYRIRFGSSPSMSATAETWLDVPAAPALLLEAPRPNPVAGHFAASFTLPDAVPACLELVDVAGRVVVRKDVGSLGQGRHSVRLGRDKAIPAGVYFLHLSHGKSQRVRRIIVVE